MTNDRDEALELAARAYAAGLRRGDLLSEDETRDIATFRARLPEALAERGLQLEEEPDGWRVVPAPFAAERLSAAA